MVIRRQEGYLIPDDPLTVMWRYMDLEKFIQLLQQRSLFFPHYERLGDPWEGAPRLANIKNSFRVVMGRMIEAIEAFPGGNVPREGTPEFWKVVEEIRESIPEYARILPNAGVSCWHMNTSESAAMWDIYAGRKKGIAIKATLQSLENAFRPNGQIHLVSGAVKYVDFNREDEEIAARIEHFFLKWHYFSYESEVRILAVPSPDAESAIAENRIGHAVPVDLNQLLHEIVIAPGQPHRTKGMIHDLLRIYGVQDANVERSTIDESPQEFIDRHTRNWWTPME